MQVVLVMFRNDGERRSFSVVRNMTIIGRREDCDLRIPVTDVSRKHCRLVRTDDGIRIEDLGSSNGTHVNGQRVQESDLNAGDIVGIGPVQFIVQIDGVPDEDEMTPPAAAAPPEHADDDDSMVGRAVPQEAAIEEDEEFQIEEEPVAEVPAEEQMELEEAPLEELPLEEVPLEEPAVEEIPEGELELEDELVLEEPAMEELPLEELTEQEAAPAAATHAEAPAAEPLGHEETTPTEEIEPVDLEAGESEWDFVVEESDGNRSAHDFKIDLDSPHEQPHQ
jgi:pSer/pThr/pTyr-binding forkhead associated (FHA) protein